MSYFIYLLSNKINGKVYVGQSKDITKRWSDHRRAVVNNKPIQIVHHAMIKYGLDDFVFEVIFGCKTQDDINWAEEYFIKYYDSRNSKNGYNLTNGGSVAPKTEEWKQKVSQTLMGHEVSLETRDKLSKSHTGKICSLEHRKNISIALSERIIKPETRQKLSKINMGNKNALGNQSGLGYRHTEEAKIKIGNAARGKSTKNKGRSWKIIDGKRVWADKNE
jgi:group I intron endonuclease